MSDYNPTWEDVEKAAIQVSRQCEWQTRFLAIGSEDLQQEAWIVFYKCVNAGNTYENKTHFVSFFITSLKNSITDMIKYKQREKEMVVDYDFLDEEGDCYFENLQESEDKTDFQTMLKEAPEEIKSILTLLITLNISRITNKKLCAFLGYDETKRNLLNELKTYFKF